MTHDNLTTIGSDNGLSPGRRQAIILTHAGILLTHLPLVPFIYIYICIYTLVNRVSISSDNGLSPIRRQVII